MFFVASKVLWALAVPSTLLVVLTLVGALLPLAGRFRRTAALLAASGSTLLLVIGLGPPGSWVLLPLENRFPQFIDDGRPVTGVVVLGGGIYPEVSAGRDQLALGDASERYIAMADLARRYPTARIVFTGGSGSLAPGEATEADTIRRFETSLGLPPGRVLYEDRSRTTWENAVETLRLVGPKPGERWLLVTSAWHMPRSVGCFRQVGFEVTPYPVDYLTAGLGDLRATQTAVAFGLQRFDLGAKEWVGLLLYRSSGRSSALFPSP